MKRTVTVLLLVSTGFSVLLSGCLMRQTVTVEGEVVKDGYVIKRPIKDALQPKEPPRNSLRY